MWDLKPFSIYTADPLYIYIYIYIYKTREALRLTTMPDPKERVWLQYQTRQ